MPKDENKFTIRIESILGGMAPLSHFANADQFRASIGIDPGSPINDAQDKYAHYPTGLLRPLSVTGTGTTVGSPMWIIENPKIEGIVYVYDSLGSVYTISDAFNVITGLTDLNDDGTATGNGAAYYDNYVYFARDTTIARYGPLNGTPSFTDDYWVSTLGKTALVSTSYPTDRQFLLSYPNHVMHRHSDGKLYIADVVGNQGTIHYIATTKTTVEGDTNNGSTYNKLQVGYGLWPTAIESYGSNLVIAFMEIVKETGNTHIKSNRAKIAFWDTTSQKVNQITWSEFPDQMVTAIKNINGVLYFTSGNQKTEGFRLTRYVGGYTFEPVAFIPSSISPFPGAVDGESNKLLFGSWTYVPNTSGIVYSYGLSGFNVTKIFSPISVYGYDGDGAITNSSTIVTALKNLVLPRTLIEEQPLIGASRGSGSSYHGIFVPSNFSGTGYNNAPSIFWSQLYRIGRPFKITKIRIPLAQVLTANMTVTPTIYFDDGQGSETLTAITLANFGTNTQSIVIRPQNLTADSNFWLELRWTGSDLCVVGLPITIEYELTDVDTNYP